jgi:3'-phosphoadenosine 5'-phosphosulfate sulfotransferase (PAPS reductase)/FAD synthetase
VTGLRREQSDARAEVPFEDTDDAGRAKLNPLADWSWADVWHYIALHGVPYNALHDRFFPSIGCEPCTRAVAVGEDFRAGRWWWETSPPRSAACTFEPARLGRRHGGQGAALSRESAPHERPPHERHVSARPEPPACPLSTTPAT